MKLSFNFKRVYEMIDEFQKIDYRDSGVAVFHGNKIIGGI